MGFVKLGARGVPVVLLYWLVGVLAVGFVYVVFCTRFGLLVWGNRGALGFV